MQPVVERLALGSPQRGSVELWANSASQSLANTVQQFGFRLNRVAPLDGSEPFTGDVTIQGNTIKFSLDSDSASGDATINRTMFGVQLIARTMNTTSKYTPAIKFMSKDPQFTTENPKLLAAIVGEALEAYAADTDGGMALTFFATNTNPGTTNIPAIVCRMWPNQFEIYPVPDFRGGTSTTATAGAQTLPANPVGFINCEVAGSAMRVPYYNT